MRLIKRSKEKTYFDQHLCSSFRSAFSSPVMSLLGYTPSKNSILTKLYQPRVYKRKLKVCSLNLSLELASRVAILSAFFYSKIFGTIFLLERPKILTTFSLASMEHSGRVNERKQKQAEKKNRTLGGSSIDEPGCEPSCEISPIRPISFL